MKNLITNLLILALAASMTGISSCKYVYFDQPLPVRGKNLKEIPEELRGHWVDANEKEDSVIITRTSFIQIDYENRTIHDYLTDTAPDYILREDKIYFMEYDSVGFPYTVQDGDIHYISRIPWTTTLSDKAILRKCKDSYVINLKRGQWWEMMYIRKMESGKIKIMYPYYERMKELKGELEYDLVNVFENTPGETKGSDTVYIHAEWKARDVVKLFPSDTANYVLFELRPDSTFVFLDEDK